MQNIDEIFCICGCTVAIVYCHDQAGKIIKIKNKRTLCPFYHKTVKRRIGGFLAKQWLVLVCLVQCALDWHEPAMTGI